MGADKNIKESAKICRISVICGLFLLRFHFSNSFLAGIWCAGGLEQLDQRRSTGQRSFNAGRYIEWSEIAALYPDYELKSNKEFEDYLNCQPEIADEDVERAF